METWGQGEPGAFELILPPGHKTVALGSPGLAGPLATFSKNETLNLDTNWSLSTPHRDSKAKGDGGHLELRSKGRGSCPQPCGNRLTIVGSLGSQEKSYIYLKSTKF